MKINSEKLYQYINELATNEKVKFKVHYDDTYVTDIVWNGESFEWGSGKFTSEAFFNPLYDFEVIEEEKEIEEIDETLEYLSHNFQESVLLDIRVIQGKINELVREVNKLRDDK